MLQEVLSAQDYEVSTRSSSGIEVPQVFCWTKMGTEAGQSLDDILRRKELERQAGSGTFAWGIGSSLGKAPSEARAIMNGKGVDVLFTPMKSPAKAIDCEPEQILLWTAYITSHGEVVDLPTHILLTSRGGEKKRSHYALLCTSKKQIADTQNCGYLDAARTRNFMSQNPVGASQVTAVVSYERNTKRHLEKPYKISFRAKFYREGFVRLANPVVLTGSLLSKYLRTCTATSVSEWKERSNEVRRIAAQHVQKHAISQGRLFA